MSIASEITSIGENLKKDYQSIANLGADLTNVDKNIENIAELLDGVYDNLPKTEYQEGTDVNLGKTIKGKLDYDNGVVGIGQTEQDSTQGYNLIDVTSGTIATDVVTGVTASMSGDVITLNGTRGDGNTDPKRFIDNLDKFGTLTSGRTYRMSLNNISGTFNGGIAITFRDASGQIEYIQTSSGGTSATRELTFSRSVTYIRIVVTGSFTASNFKFQLMLQDTTEEKPYEPYTGGYSSPSPNWKQQVECVAGRNKADYSSTYTSGSLSNLGAFNLSLNNSIDIETSKEYYFSADIKRLTGTGTTTMNVIRSGNNSGQTCVAVNRPNMTSDYQRYVFKCTYTQAQTLTQVAFQVLTDNSTTIEVKNIMVATENTPYLPYNTIEEVVSGKNLARMPLNTFTSNSVTSISQNGEIKVSGTPSQNWFTIIPKTTLDKPLPVGDYTFSRQNLSTTARLVLATYDKNDVQKNYYMSHANTQYYNFTTTDEIVAYGIFSDSNSTSTSLNFTDYIMIEKGTTTGTNYEPYKTPKTYQFSLGDHKFYGIGNYKDTIRRSSGKNLFDKSKVINSYYVNAGTGELSGSTTAYNASDWIEVSPGDYVWGATSTTGYSLVVYDENKQYVRSVGRSIVQQIKVTIAEGEKYVRYTVSTADLDTQQFERGSLATDYEPYGVGVWYKYGKIGEVVYTGNEEWTLVSSLSNSNRTVFQTVKPTGVYKYPITPQDFNEIAKVICNKFIPTSQQATWKYYEVGFRTAGADYIYFIVEAGVTLQDFKTNIIKDTILNYLLANPTIDIITGTLAEQLEAWWNGQTLNGTTIITSNGNLPMIIKVRGLKGGE